MGNMFLFALIVGIASALILIPVYGNNKSTDKKSHNKSTKEDRKFIPGTIVAVLVIIIPSVYAFYYFTNYDRNLSSLWVLAIVVTAIGAVFSTGLERKVKAVLFVASLVLGVYFLTAFLFNSDEKYEIAKMDQKVEIKTFDEKETPASVPPEFARNKMKKAFGQVPNTSYYELGNLQIQKVDNEYVYIAPVEFSGFFKWWKGKETPGYFTLSATDSSDNPKFIQSTMIYTPSSFFNKSIERHIRMQFPKHIFYGDVQLEIDDEGKPYYIRSFGEYISARNGFDVKGVVVVDSKNGRQSLMPYQMFRNLLMVRFPRRLSAYKTAISETISTAIGIVSSENLT